jgi:hypothetical protein
MSLISQLYLSSIINAKDKSGIYFQQHVSYEIKVILDVNKNILTGIENLSYKNNSHDTLKYVWFHLYPNAYKEENSIYAKESLDRGVNDFYYTKESDRGNINIDQISGNNTSLKWNYKTGDETEMIVYLQNNLLPGDSIEFKISFEVKIPVIISRLGHSKYHYEITQWYPKIAVYDSEGWHNDGYHFLGEFYGDYGDFKVSINVPEDMWVAASGILTDEKEYERIKKMTEFTKNLDSMPADKFEMKIDSLKTLQKQIEKKLDSDSIKYKTVTFYAENVHDYAMACDYRYLVKKTNYENTDVYIFVLLSNYKSWREAPNYSSDALKYMSRWYGKYIYKTLFVVDSQNPYGGMEYPNLILCSVKDSFGFRMLEEVIFHEIGHQWFYGMLGNNEIDEAWLDEGLTMFSEKRYFLEKYNGDFNIYPLMHTILGEESTNHSEMFKSNLFSLSSFNPNLPPAAFTSYKYRTRVEFNNVYLRPAFALSMLQYIIGDSTFNLAMRNYYNDNLLRHPNAQSLIKEFNSVTNKDWQWYFNQWVYSNKQCDYAAGDLSSRLIDNGTYETTFDVIRADSIVMPLTIDFKTDKDSLIKINLLADKQSNLVKIKSADKIISANIDPDKSLLELNPRDNSTTSNKINFSTFLPTQSFYENTFYAIPWFLKNKLSEYGYGAAFLFYDRLPDLFGNESNILGASAFYYPSYKNLDYSIGFRGTTNLNRYFNSYYLKYNRWNGERNFYLGIEYRIGRYKFENPSHNLLFSASFKDVYDDRYTDIFRIQKGKDCNLGIRYTLAFDYNLSSFQYDLEIRQSIRQFDGDYNYTKLTLESCNDFLLSRRFSITNYINAGIIGGDYPRQKSLFISPANKIEYTDFGSWAGHRYYYEKDFSSGLAGYVNNNINGRYLISLKTDVNIQTYMFHSVIEPFFLKVFFETAKLWKSVNVFQSDRQTFYDLGVGFKWIGIDLSLCLFKNHDIINDGTKFRITSDNRLKFNSFILRLDLTYMYQMALGMK